VAKKQVKYTSLQDLNGLKQVMKFKEGLITDKPPIELNFDSKLSCEEIISKIEHRHIVK
jgi:hypothetical protein